MIAWSDQAVKLVEAGDAEAPVGVAQTPAYQTGKAVERPGVSLTATKTDPSQTGATTPAS